MYTYCFVRFSANGKKYSYISDDPEIEPGDFVEVDGKQFPILLEVLDVVVCSEENAPYPPAQTKHVSKVVKKCELVACEKTSHLALPEVPSRLRTDSFGNVGDNDVAIEYAHRERKSEYTYCFVQFDTKGKKYAYISDDPNVEPGDFVQIERKIFPIILEVLEVAVYSEKNAPYPPSQTKSVTRAFKKTEVIQRKEVTSSDLDDDPSGLREDLFDFLRDYDTVPEPKCSEEFLIAFEKKNDTRFPLEYRRFLLEIGNGLQIPRPSVFNRNDYRYVVGLPKKLKIDYEISRSFLITDRYDETTKEKYISPDCYLEDPATNDIDNICICCSYRKICPQYIDEFSREDAFFYGTHFLVSAGCTYSYHLIMNGPHRGEVWFADDRQYFAPVSKSFSEFLKYLLDAEMI